MSKMFGIRATLSSTKEGLTKLVRLFRREVTVSTPETSRDRRKLNALSPQVFLIAKRRGHEIEMAKDMIMTESRHQTWKSGGPL